MSVFDRSIIAGNARIGGVELRCFSAFHALALMTVDSPYITRRRLPSKGDTTVALTICALTRSDGIGAVEQSLASFSWRWYWLWHNHTKISDQLFDYIANSVEFPRVWESPKEKKGSNSGAPWPYYLVNTIARHIPCIKYDSLWDMPIAELICHKAIIAEDNGAFQIAENDIAGIEYRRTQQEGLS